MIIIEHGPDHDSYPREYASFLNTLGRRKIGKNSSFMSRNKKR